MRKTLVLLGLLALLVPVAGVAGPRAGDGTLTIEDGRGKVTVRARGGLIGRLDRGTVTVFDLTPRDAYAPVVTGDDQPIAAVGANGVRYGGSGIRFRILGGNFRVVVEGRGIDLSVVGRGEGVLQGETLTPGLYSLDGADCRKDPASCTPLPPLPTRFRLGNDDNKGQSRSG